MTNSGSDPKRPGEFALIAELFAPLATSPGAFRLQDDAAIATPPPGHDLIVTTDALVEGVHFLAGDPPGLIGRKALRVNLSDLGAKGCLPAGYLLTLSLPATIGMPWLQAFASGLFEDQREFGVSLYGGDTTATPGRLTISITAFGHVPVGMMLRRSGAKPGDLAFVSGTIGDAGGGLACLKGDGQILSPKQRDELIERFREPEPRLALGQALVGTASASLDVSDGLLADLGHIAKTSHVRVEIDAARVPLSPSLSVLWPDPTERIARAVTSGDDYELAFTAPPGKRAAIAEIARRLKLPIAEIGRVMPGNGIDLLDSAGSQVPMARKGYTHF